VRRRFLDVAQGHASVESGGDEGVAQRVRTDRLGDPGPAGDPPHDASGPVTVETPAVTGDEDRAAGPLADS
jgi:hypothetical protein